jgi:hypothetical protein
MCSICHSTPCRPQCPNAEEKAVKVCIGCGADIIDGETYYDIDGEPFCEDCINASKRVAEAI